MGKEMTEYWGTSVLWKDTTIQFKESREGLVKCGGMWAEELKRDLIYLWNRRIKVVMGEAYRENNEWKFKPR